MRVTKGEPTKSNLKDWADRAKAESYIPDRAKLRQNLNANTNGRGLQDAGEPDWKPGKGK